MNKKNILIILVGLIITSGLIYYNNQNTRRKSVVKTKFLHFFNLVDNDWQQSENDSCFTFISPTMVIDGKLKSMEGSIVGQYFNLFPNNKSPEELIWINSFKSKAINSNSKKIPDDFICHTNIDYKFYEHYARWDLYDELHRNFPRLTSLSNGKIEYSFPDGFGFPIFNNEQINIQTQVLNHNYPDTLFKVKHQIEIGYKKHHKNLKPLLSRPIYVQVPIAKNFKEKHIGMISKTECLPVDEKLFEYDSINKRKHTGFWIIPKGKSSYSYNVTEQLAIKDSLQLHMIVPHLHPFTEKLHLIDRTNDTILFTSNVSNFINKIGLKNTPIYKDKNGFTLYNDHEYELKVDINNTSNEEQDMMAAFFCFFMDRELNKKIKEFEFLKNETNDFLKE